MSVYKPKSSPFFHFDFQVRGHRFHGSTRCANRREAEAIERAEREIARALLKRGPDDAALLTLDDAAGRYWSEVGQHHTCADETWTNLERLLACPHLGKDKRLVEINGNDVALGVAWRRGHHKWNRLDAPLISNATVNRSFTEVLQKLFTRAKVHWGARFDREPEWGKYMLTEPDEYVRELRADEADKLTLATRADYAPFIAFARATGLRLRECLLRWSEIDWDVRLITKRGKGGRIVTAPITAEVEAILRPLMGHHPEFVFTYVAKRSRGHRIRGKRHPITFSGAKTQWRRMRARGQDSEAVIRRRMESAEEEISHSPEFDYVIINKDFDEARRDLQAIIRVERLKRQS